MEPVDSSAKYVSKNSSVPLMISNPKVLACCICVEPLSIPVFMCDNGHIVCSTCCSKHRTKCDKCSKHSSLKRCKAYDNLLQYIEMPCPNENYGCRETISYSQKRKHEEECIYVPCYCPISGCDFVASIEVLSNHFKYKHGNSRILFSYGPSFVVSLKANDEVIVLQEKYNGKLFILNNITMLQGNAINISCIGPNSSKARYNYDILALSEISSAHLHSSPKNVQRCTSTTSSVSLLIPSDYFGSSEPLKLEILITIKIQIFVKTLTGNMIIAEVKSSDTMADVKAKVQDKEWFPLHEQYLVFANKKLDDRHTIADHNIQEKSILVLCLRAKPSA